MWVVMSTLLNVNLVVVVSVVAVAIQFIILMKKQLNMLLTIGILGDKKMDDFMVGPQCEELDPEEVGYLLIDMYKDLEELYGDDKNEESIN
jgi:hypothetical protein